jgi:hypothetical protein
VRCSASHNARRDLGTTAMRRSPPVVAYALSAQLSLLVLHDALIERRLHVAPLGFLSPVRSSV